MNLIPICILKINRCNNFIGREVIEILLSSCVGHALNGSYKTRPCNVQIFLTAVKYQLLVVVVVVVVVAVVVVVVYICSKHRLWVHLRTASETTLTYGLN